MRKVLKIFLYVLLGILILIIGLVIAINTPWGKNQIKNFAVNYLQKKLDTHVEIGGIDFSIPNSVNLSKVLVLDKANDTILWVNQLDIDINMLKLLKTEISVSKIGLNDADVNMYRTATDTNYNYQFVIDSFVGKKDPTLKETVDTAKSSPIKLDVGVLNITNTRYRLNDTIGGMLFGIKVNSLVLKPKTIDLEHLKFEVIELSGDTINSYFYALPSALPPPPPDTSASADVTLIVDKLLLNNASFAMKDATSGLGFNITAKELAAKMPWFNLIEKKIDIDYFNLVETNAAVAFQKIKKVTQQTTQNVDNSKSEDTSSWIVKVNDLLFKDIGFAFNDFNKPEVKDGIDYAHLDFRNFYLTGSDLLYSTDTISGLVKNLSLIEKSGLEVQSLKTNFVYHNKGALLDDLYLKTPNTLIQDKIAVSYKSLESIEKEMGKMRLDLAIKQSVISFKDIFIFLPAAQKQQLKDFKNKKVNLTLLAQGPLEALILNKIYLQGLNKTVVDGSGIVYGLPDANRLRYNLKLNNLASTYADIKGFIPKSIQDQLNIPAQFSISGNLNGTTTAYTPDLKIHTSDGNAIIKGFVDVSKTGRELYNLNLTTQSLNLGKILKMEDLLGKITMSGKLDGQGFDPKTLEANLDANIIQAQIKGYNYQNMYAVGHMKGKNGALDLKSKDPNAFMTLKATLDRSNKYYAVNSNLNIEYLNLKELGFTTDDIAFTGDVDINAPSLNIDYPKAEISILNPFLTMNGTTYLLDNTYINSNPIDSIQDITIDFSKLLSARLTGHVPITKMGDVILAHVNKYYKINDQKYLDPLAFDMNLNGTINYHKLYRKLVPDLRPFDTVSFFAIANPTDLNLGLSAPKLRYADYQIDTLAFSAVEYDSSLAYVLSLNKFATSGLQFFNSSLYGNVKNDSINSYLNLADQEGKEQFALGLHTMIDDNSNVRLKLAKGFKLNYEDWLVSPNNRIVAGNKGFFIDALNMTNGNQSISAQSKDTIFNSPFVFSIKNFELANLTKMISKDTIIADGILTADAAIDMLDTNFIKINATANIDSLQVMGAHLGNLSAKAMNQSAENYLAQMHLLGYGNDVAINGNYYTKPVNGNDLDFIANFNAFTMKSIEAFSFGNLNSSSGILKGNLNIKGKVTAPLIDGELETDSLKTTLTTFNTFLSIPKEKIQFIPRTGLSFSNFDIYDRSGRKATLNGQLLTTSFTDFLLNMRFSAAKWEAMNSNSKHNESFYGRMILSANLGLTGPMTAPNIDGDITIHDSTDFHYAMLDNPELVSTEGVVEFYDSKVIEQMDEYENKIQKAKYLLSQSSSLNVNVDIEKGAQFTVVIDPETGDNLKVRGIAFLNANLGADGNMALAGTYELEDGHYDLSIEFIKKKFKIQKGSIIQLAGDPLDAEANITAIYEANIAPIDLFQKQGEAEDLGRFRQRLPFQVLLKMSGKVMKPTITFDIVVKEGGLNTVAEDVKSDVNMKFNELRNNPSELNKQVVAVLAFGRFVSEDPFSTSGSGFGIENAVRQSASRFLSEQLNRMAGNLIDGIELDMGINSSEDYSSGQKVNRTDLSINASKRLFNDRLKISIGNDFALEGQSTSAANQNFLPGNISADYLLTADGRYVMRGYRKTELQNIIKGYIVETGLSFRLGLEYTRFRQLIMSQTKYRAYMRKKRQKEREKQAQQKLNISGILNQNKYNILKQN